MSLETQLAKIIKQESEKLIARYHRYHNHIQHSHDRNIKLLGKNAREKYLTTPDYWKEDKKLNPFYVRKKYRSIAKSVAKRIQEKTYKPNKPFVKKIKKESGGFRQVSIYQIQDAAVSRLFYLRLLSKNKHRFSSFSYAYRDDRNVHFAIQDISVELKSNERTFIAEFDFSDFFGSISHNFLKQQFDKNGFYISAEERFIIRAFLSGRDRGIPQGTSISLLLANLTCWEFDKSLEREGVKFSRYADDTVIWTHEYSKICNAYALINKFSEEAGLKINIAKSEGISLLTTPGMKAEITPKTSLDFLGYSLSTKDVSIKGKSINKIKKEISYILYRHLIQPINKTKIRGHTLPANGEDVHLLSAIMQVRRYMYGGLTTAQIKNYLSGRTKKIYFKGIMSFYPLVDNQSQLKGLDGWLISTIYRTIQKRAKIFKTQHNYQCSHSFPYNLPKKHYVEGFSKVTINNKSLMTIPSFMLIHKAIQKGLIDQGIENVMNPQSLNYDY